MPSTAPTDKTVEPAPFPSKTTPRDVAILLFAFFFPTLLTWAYFVVGKRLDPSVAKAIFIVGKTAQFAFPALISAFVLRERWLARRPNRRGLFVGALFGAVVAAVIFFGGEFLLANAAANPNGSLAPIFERFRAELSGRLEPFGLANPKAFLAVLVFYSIFHSGLEEYYWRWFAFGRAARRFAFVPAAILANAAFTSHHILLLGVYFGYGNALTWICALGVFVGGLVWQAIYRKSDSIYGAWLSHGLIDAGIFAVGYALLF